MTTLDEKGRCCGRKPIHYKRHGGGMKFCCRCDREFDPETGKQRQNWAWGWDGEKWVRKLQERKP